MSVTILQGDALTMLSPLPDASAQVCVTSPPYFALRDYGVDGQIGLERSPQEFIARLVAVFDEVKRVLHPSGLCFVNLGDSYSGSGKGPSGHNGIGDQETRQGFRGGSNGGFHDRWDGQPGKRKQEQARNRDGQPSFPGIPAKNLLLIPERFAIAMQDAGWYVRSRIAWCKKSAMPESVRDRPTSAWEHIWMFSKSPRYFYDAEAVRQPNAPGVHTHLQGAMDNLTGLDRNGTSQSGLASITTNPAGASLRNFWLLGPAPSNLEHFASFPPEIPKRCILAGSSSRGQCPACAAPWGRVVERVGIDYGMGVADTSGHQPFKANGGARTQLRTPTGHTMTKATWETKDWAASCSCDAGPPVPQTVLDPFLGSGTTALVADRLDRHAIGIELNPEYAAMARRRIEQDAGWLADVTTVAAPVHVQGSLMLGARAERSAR